MRNKPMNQDARLLLQLDRLQEQAEMRKARLWWRDEFWPDNASDYLKIELAHGKKESRWLRQVPTYWGMATSFVLDGTLSEEAFLDAEFSQEMFLMFAKVRPFLTQLRKRHRQSGLHGERRAIHSEIEGSAQAPPIGIATIDSSAQGPQVAATGMFTPWRRGSRSPGNYAGQFGDRQLPAAANSCSPTAN